MIGLLCSFKYASETFHTYAPYHAISTFRSNQGLVQVFVSEQKEPKDVKIKLSGIQFLLKHLQHHY